MSFDMAGNGFAPSNQLENGNGQEINELGSNIQDMSLSNSRHKKKRAARAFHTEFNTPNLPGVPNFSAPSTPGTNQQQHNFSPQSPAQSSIPVASHVVQPEAELADPNIDMQILDKRYLDQARYMTPINSETPEFNSFFTFEHASPPTAGTQYHTVDQGTAAPNFMRSTMYFVPETEQLRKATKLPLSVTIRPFNPILATEEPVPIVDMREIGKSSGGDYKSVGPPRCSRCRTYMNPSMQHTVDNRFMCNICQFGNNVVPDDYTSFLDAQGYRVDRYNRPELHKGVYDIIVPEQYNFNGSEGKNQPMHYVFLIDISEQSIRHNLPVLLADTIRATLYSNEESGGFSGRFALMTFDKKIQYFSLSPKLDSTQIYVSADLEDPFIPFSEGLFADPEESRLVIEDMLNYLELIDAQDNFADPETCFSAACRAAMMCLQSVGGGKIVSILSNLPTWGPGGLKFKDNRSVGRSPNAETESSLLLPDNPYYKQLSKDFISNSVGLDCFVISPVAVDLSNIGWLCSVTGGQVNRWTNFNIERDGRAFIGRFMSSVNKTRGYQGQLKLRCSNGLQVNQYYGTSSSISDTTVAGTIQDPVVPILHEDQSFTVLLSYDGKLDTRFDCHFQAAILYTDLTGLRKVRVINLVLAVAERLEDVFNLVDEDAIITTIVRDSLSFVGNQPLTEIRESVNEKLVEVFTQYRAMSELGHNMNRTLTNQLLFPEKLKHLPMYMLSFLKSNAIRTSTTISTDSRLEEMYHLLNIPVERLLYKLYPALVELHSLLDDEGFPEQHGFIRLPKFKDLSLKSLDYGVYILCDGETVWVWIHPNANILLIKDLFGDQIESVDQINPLCDELPELSTNISIQARNLVKYFQQKINGILTTNGSGIHIIRLGMDALEQLFNEKLVEDSLNGSVISTNSPSYSDYLTNLHKAIRVKLDNEKSSNSVKQSLTQAQHNENLAQHLSHFL